MELVMNTDEVQLYRGDCRIVMASLPDNSVDSIVTDPPYELGFMGRQWDRSGIAFDPDVWAQALRVLKPGGHLLAFGGTRTWHRVAVAIEDAGFEIRDSIAWLYGSGFPKSMDVSRAIDKAAGATPIDTGIRSPRHGGGVIGAGSSYEVSPEVPNITAPATDAAREWEGWGTALKPAHEPVVVARKPFQGTVAANVLAQGTGAINIDASRIQMSAEDAGRIEAMGGFGRGGYTRPRTDETFMQGTAEATAARAHEGGRWPSNVLLDESQAAELDAQSGILTSGAKSLRSGDPIVSKWRESEGRSDKQVRAKDSSFELNSGGASRFFYVAKAPTHERPEIDGVQHATVKPLTLMRYLVKLVTPPGGTVLEPFAGSGTTLEAAILEGFSCIGIELDEDGTHIPLIMQRLGKPLTPAMF